MMRLLVLGVRGVLSFWLSFFLWVHSASLPCGVNTVTPTVNAPTPSPPIEIAFRRHEPCIRPGVLRFFTPKISPPYLRLCPSGAFFRVISWRL